MAYPDAFQAKRVTRSKDETAVEKSIAFMHDNMHRKLSVAEIASTVDYSSSHLHQLFRSAMGYLPVDYFIHLKMQQACHYLTHSNLKIYEISSLLGYDDPYFFRERLPEPTVYRPNNSGKLNHSLIQSAP